MVAPYKTRDILKKLQNEAVRIVTRQTRSVSFCYRESGNLALAGKRKHKKLNFM